LISRILFVEYRSVSSSDLGWINLSHYRYWSSSRLITYFFLCREVRNFRPCLLTCFIRFKSLYCNFVKSIMIRYDIFVNSNWVVTRWQKYSTHLHTNNTQNDTKLTIHRATQQFRKSSGRAPSWLVIPWHLPYNRGKSTENLSQVSRV
jgi:hypothetical protein